MVRPSSCDETKMRRGFWMPKDDPKMTTHVSNNDAGKRTGISKRAALKRCGKSCRLRKTNHLRPDLKHDNFSPQEKELVIRLHAAIGSRWSIIAQQLPGRTENDVKNLWNTKLRKKLTEMGIDPVTHKPFSQILADYGNLGALWGSPVGPLNPNIHNHSMTPEIKPTQECFFNQTTSPSSSSSTCSTAAKEKLSPTYTWRDFLVEDELLPPDFNTQEQEIASNISGQQQQNVTPHVKTSLEIPSSSHSCFLDGVLDHENETFLDFSGLHLEDDPFYLYDTK